LFHQEGAGISLLLVLFMESVFITQVFGLSKLEILMKEKTGESMPRYCKIFAGYVMPVFSGLLLLYATYSEFSAKKAKTRPGWSSGITWL
ncbi:hypothetical protein, partial [Enterococcus rotai]|uniref:hypothetical protein n=1 Tax=Enterococcus rotai TaxID=118060 RepID=UPI0035C74E6B